MSTPKNDFLNFFSTKNSLTIIRHFFSLLIKKIFFCDTIYIVQKKGYKKEWL